MNALSKLVSSLFIPIFSNDIKLDKLCFIFLETCLEPLLGSVPTQRIDRCPGSILLAAPKRRDYVIRKSIRKEAKEITQWKKEAGEKSSAPRLRHGSSKSNHKASSHVIVTAKVNDPLVVFPLSQQSQRRCQHPSIRIHPSVLDLIRAP